MSSIVRPSCPISSALRTPARAARSPSPIRRAAPATRAIGARTTRPRNTTMLAARPRMVTPGDQELAVAGAGHLLVERLEAEADPHHPAHRVARSVALLAGLAVLERAEEGQDAAPVELLGELLGLGGLHGAAEQRMVDALARLSTEPRDALDQIGLEAGVGVDLLDGGEVGEGLDAVLPVHVDPAHVPQLSAQLLDEAPRDVGPGLEHPVLDGGEDGGRQHAGGLPMARLERHPLPREVEEEEQAEPQDQDADDEREHLGPEPLAQDLAHAHRVPPVRRPSACGRRAGLGRPGPSGRRIALGYIGRSPPPGRPPKTRSSLPAASSRRWRPGPRPSSREEVQARDSLALLATSRHSLDEDRHPESPGDRLSTPHAVDRGVCSVCTLQYASCPVLGGRASPGGGGGMLIAHPTGGEVSHDT